MLNKYQSENRKEIQIISIEDLVPKDHILRDIDRAINFDFIYDEVKDMYSADTGRPSVDPVDGLLPPILRYSFAKTLNFIEKLMRYQKITFSIPHLSTV